MFRHSGRHCVYCSEGISSTRREQTLCADARCMRAWNARRAIALRALVSQMLVEELNVRPFGAGQALMRFRRLRCMVRWNEWRRKHTRGLFYNMPCLACGVVTYLVLAIFACLTPDDECSES